MSYTATLLVALGIWLFIGALTSYGMGRRGHSPFTWGLLGAVFGPLVIPLVIEGIGEERDRKPRVLHAAAEERGLLSVLVGIDGSEESAAAVKVVLALFGAHLQRVSLAEVISYDASAMSGSRARDEAMERLELHARAMEMLDPQTLLLAGRPADALIEAAQEGGYDVLAVGSKGRGVSRMLLGSVARQLAANARVPVLIVGKDASVVDRGASARVVPEP